MPFEIKLMLVTAIIGGGILMLTLGAAYNSDVEKLDAAVRACGARDLSIYPIMTKTGPHILCQDSEGRLYAVPRGD